MGLPLFWHKQPTVSQTSEEVTSTTDSDQISLEARNEQEIKQHPNEVTKDALPGVQKVEAAALVWNKKAVWATYAWIWVCFFVLALHSSISSNVIFNAYANFKSAPELATASILATIIGGVLKLPIAKALNIWGRAESLLVFVAIFVMGTIILASCKGPSTYAAGYVFYWIGYNGIYLILDVFIADTSGLRNRAFTFAFASTPFICTAFTGPLAAQSFLEMTSWRWAYGTFAIVFPFVLLPLAVVFKFYQWKAEKLGHYKRVTIERTKMESLTYYYHEFDVVGLLLLMAAFILVLLPFSLTTYGRAEYKGATFIAMEVIGFCLFFVFAAWEKFFARKQFIRYELLRQPTVIGACLLAALLNLSYYSWDLYFYNFCIVVYDLSVSDAGYMLQIYNIGSCFWAPLFGLYIRQTRHFKYACLFFGLPLMLLGAGLMIHFRGQHENIGYIVMCQILIAIAGGTVVIGQDMAVMSAADHDGVPMMLSILGLFGSLGGSIGYAVSSAIFTNVFPKSLRSALPDSAKEEWLDIYLGGYITQMTYPVGSEIRDAINFAWGDSQKYGCIAATATIALGFPCIAVWKNYNVDKKQNKGLMI